MTLLIAEPNRMPDERRPAEREILEAPQEVTPGLEPLSFEGVYGAHVDYLWRALRLLGVPSEQLEDACQDVLTIIYRRLDHFEMRSSIRSWIFGIARRVAANYARQRRRKSNPLIPLETVAEHVGTAAPAHAASVEAAEVLRRFFVTLDEPTQMLFALALVEQLAAASVATELGLSTSTVHSRVRALRKELRDFMERGDLDA